MTTLPKLIEPVINALTRPSAAARWLTSERTTEFLEQIKKKREQNAEQD